MTELQSSISSLKEVIATGNQLLSQLKKAQKDLETPPQHKWEHGDIFKTNMNVIMVYLKFAYGRPRTVCVVGGCGGLVEHKNFDGVLRDAKFLFNIKEKL